MGFVWFWWVWFGFSGLCLFGLFWQWRWWCGVVVRVWFGFACTRLKCGLFWIVGAFGGGQISPNMQKRGVETPFRFFVVFLQNHLNINIHVEHIQRLFPPVEQLNRNSFPPGVVSIVPNCIDNRCRGCAFEGFKRCRWNILTPQIK